MYVLRRRGEETEDGASNAQDGDSACDGHFLDRTYSACNFALRVEPGVRGVFGALSGSRCRASMLSSSYSRGLCSPELACIVDASVAPGALEALELVASIEKFQRAQKRNIGPFRDIAPRL